MKKFIILFIICNAVFLLVGGALLIISESSPFHPGHPLYSIQVTSEQWRLNLTPGETRRTDRALNLAEHRLAHLAQAQQPEHINLAGQLFDQTLAQTVLAIRQLPEPIRPEFKNRLTTLLGQADVVIAGLPANIAIVNNLAQKIEALQTPETLHYIVTAPPPQSELHGAIPVPFLGDDVDHSPFPLTGAHKLLACDTCHPRGTYTGIPTACEGCHAPPTRNFYNLLFASFRTTPPNPYPNHFPGNCTDCHTTNSWTPYRFDHIGITECQSCHIAAQPPGHYPGTCITCHSSAGSWQAVSFSHRQTSGNCATCHAGDIPANHQARQAGTPMAAYQISMTASPTEACTNCHLSVSSWQLLTFDHTGLTTCTECHPQPDGHYDGPCNNCHTTAAWNHVQFNHTGLNLCDQCHPLPANHYPGACVDCHTPDGWHTTTLEHTGLTGCVDCHRQQALSGHYQGQCSNCHIENNWLEIFFDHTGLPGCADCHSRDQHYPGQCSTCHTTSNWADYWFNHTNFTNCQACHSRDNHDYGQCSDCHNSSDWDDISFDHHDAGNCLECHRDRMPEVHYPLDCAQCHTTGNWEYINVNHSGLDNCQACHTQSNHYPGQCSNCHNTTAWTDISFNHDGFDDCITCHPTPDGHWPGQCSDCHFTDNWLNIDFDHTTYTNCKSCHPRPSGHSRGQCSRCHNTDSWEVEPTPEPAPSATPEPGETPTPTPTSTPGNGGGGPGGGDGGGSGPGDGTGGGGGPGSGSG